MKRTLNGLIVAGKRVKCESCKTVFITESGTRRENMGEDYGAGTARI